MHGAFYLDRLEDWLSGMTEADLKELDYKYLGDTRVSLGHYEKIYKKGLELIKSEPYPKDLLLKILDEYMERLSDIPEFPSNDLNQIEFDADTKEKLKALILFGTQAALIKENSKIYHDLQVANQNYKDLLSVITHEFKNALTSIYGYNRIITKRVAEGRLDQLNLITKNIDGLSKNLFNVIERLVDMSMIEQDKLTPHLKLVKLIENVIKPVVLENYSQLESQQMAVEIICRDDDVTLSSDMYLLQIVFRNLIQNALQYGYKNTDIEITISKIRDRVRIEFYNQGAGIEKKNLSKIFEKFSRFHTRSNRTNVGIGLFTVKHIIQLHNGSIVAESEKDKYMRFIIVLPI